MNHVEILMQRIRVESESTDEADVAVVRNIAYCQKSAQRIYAKASTIAESTNGSEYGENSISHPVTRVEQWIRNLDDIMSTVSSSDATSHPLSDLVSDDVPSTHSRGSDPEAVIHDLSPEEIEVKISVAKKLLNQSIASISDSKVEKASLHLRSALNLPLPLPSGNSEWNTLIDEIKYQLAKCQALGESPSELTKEDHAIKQRLLEWHQAEANQSWPTLDSHLSETHLLQALHIAQDLQILDDVETMKLDLTLLYVRQRNPSKSALATDILIEIQYQWPRKPWKTIYRIATAWLFLDNFALSEKMARHVLRIVSAECGRQNEDYYRIVMLLVAILYARNVADETIEWLSRIPDSFLISETKVSLSNLGISPDGLLGHPDLLLKVAIYYEDFIMAYYLLKADQEDGRIQCYEDKACRKPPPGHVTKERSYLGIAASRGALAIASLLLDFGLYDTDDSCLYLNLCNQGSLFLKAKHVDWSYLSPQGFVHGTAMGLKEDLKSLFGGTMNDGLFDYFLHNIHNYGKAKGAAKLSPINMTDSDSLNADKSIWKYRCTTIIHAAAINKRYAMVKFLLERKFDFSQLSWLSYVIHDALHLKNTPQEVLVHEFLGVSTIGTIVESLNKIGIILGSSSSDSSDSSHFAITCNPGTFLSTGPSINLLEIASLLEDRELLELLNPYFKGQQFGEAVISSHTRKCCQVQNAQENLQVGTILHSAFVLGCMWHQQSVEPWVCDLLEADEKLNQNEAKRNSALHWAIVADLPEAVKILVQKGHTLNTNEILVGGASYHAICSGSHQALMALKTSKYRDEDGSLKYHKAMHRIFSKDFAGLSQTDDRIRSFLKALQNADLVELEAINSSGRTLLLEAIVLDGYFLDIVVLQLIELGVNLDARDMHGVSPTNELCGRLRLRSPAKQAWKTPFSRDRRQDLVLYHMDNKLHCLEILLHIVEAGAHVDKNPCKERKESESRSRYNRGNDLTEMYRTWMKMEPGKFHDYRIKALTSFMEGSPRKIMECMYGTDGRLSPDQCYLFRLEYITKGSAGLRNVQPEMTKIFKR
jgi:ankyrin repeat protein